MQTDYREFLARKHVVAPAAGFHVPQEALNPALFPFQRAVTQWALQRGRAAIFARMGLGKTPMQLSWADEVHRHTGRDVLILAPLAVSAQTVREGVKFGVHVTPCRDQSDVRPGINITNYERLERFDPLAFVGMVADESSILKSYMGQTKQRVIAFANELTYLLACTATPAPNDHLELGNHAEMLRVMSSHEMITRWFIADQSAMGTYRLKQHGADDFWRWVATWAMSLRQPSDLGFSDEGFILPELHTHVVTVDVDVTTDTGGLLFRIPDMNATGLHQEGRRTVEARADAVANLVNTRHGGALDTWAVWCNTDYEADALLARIPDAVEVRGSQSVEEKEAKLEAFSAGNVRVMITKPRIGGFGLNWQHCAHTAFVGLSYSFEQLHQAIGRLHRFGQTREVQAYIVGASTEGAIWETVRRKQTEHELMQDAMVAAADAVRHEADQDRRARYNPTKRLRTPSWLYNHLEVAS